MITLITALPFSLFCSLLCFLMVGCFIGAYQHRAKGQKAETILFTVIGIALIPAFIFRFVQEKGYGATTQSRSFLGVCVSFFAIFLVAYIYALNRYRKATLSYAEKQRILGGLIIVPAAILILIILRIVWE